MAFWGLLFVGIASLRFVCVWLGQNKDILVSGFGFSQESDLDPVISRQRIWLRFKSFSVRICNLKVKKTSHNTYPADPLNTYTFVVIFDTLFDLYLFSPIFGKLWKQRMRMCKLYSSIKIVQQNFMRYQGRSESVQIWWGMGGLGGHLTFRILSLLRYVVWMDFHITSNIDQNILPF